MNAVVHELIERAQALPIIERAKLIESLIESMSHADKEIEALWAIEAEARIDALERGDIELEGEPNLLTEFRARQT